MGLDKYSTRSDAIGNLYRAALFLARGQGEEELGVELVQQAAKKLPGLTSRLKSLLKKYSIQSHTSRMILAEKLLDEYLLVRDA